MEHWWWDLQFRKHNSVMKFAFFLHQFTAEFYLHISWRFFFSLYFWIISSLLLLSTFASPALSKTEHHINKSGYECAQITSIFTNQNYHLRVFVSSLFPLDETNPCLYLMSSPTPLRSSNGFYCLEQRNCTTHFCFCIQMSGPLEQQKRRSQYQMCNDYNCVASSPVEKRFDVHPGPRRHPLASPSSDNADRLSPHTAQQSKPLHLGRVALCRKESRCLAINQIGTFQPCDSVQCKWTIKRSEWSCAYTKKQDEWKQ